jgi:hypothetical protein
LVLLRLYGAGGRIGSASVQAAHFYRLKQRLLKYCLFFSEKVFLALNVYYGIFKQSMGARNRVGIGLLYRAARLHIVGGIGSLESILGLLISLNIRATKVVHYKYAHTVGKEVGKLISLVFCIPNLLFRGS